jgi:paraquat-inducible protein A
VTTAASRGLARCHDCALVSPMSAHGHSRCPRCNSPLHMRRKNALSRTWALLLAGYVFYIPANVLPVSTIVYLGRGEPDTILSGVLALFRSGDAPVALLLFFASITVPVLKLLMLTWLAASVQFGWTWRAKDRTRIYRLVEVIGRWSMLDMFVVSLSVALVQLGAVANVEPGNGAVFFAGVVVLTMFAATSFDPRLIWDRIEEET